MLMREPSEVDPHYFGGRRVLVTGGTGFLGSQVSRSLRHNGADVVAIGSRDFDLTVQSHVRKLFDDVKPELVIHAAGAVGGIGANVANPGRFLYANALMGLLVLEEARRTGIDKVVMVSTTCAYPENASVPLKEESLWDGRPAGATGPYGVAKRMLHEAVDAYHRQYGTKAAVLMLSNLYGPGDHFEDSTSHVLAALIHRIVTAKRDHVAEITNWGTGEPTREFLHVADAARAILLAAARWDDPSPINVGTGIETSVRELSDMIAAAVAFGGTIHWDPTKPDGQPRRYLDVAKARQFGFEAEIDLHDGIAETVEWYEREMHPDRAGSPNLVR